MSDSSEIIDEPKTGGGPYAALRIAEFRNFILARVSITLALQIQATVVGWQMWDLTHDPLSLGLIGLAEAIPSISVSLYAGHVADIIDRRKIILITISVLVFCSAALLFFTLDPGKFLLAYGAVAIYSVIFVSGIARGFMSPATFSFMPQLIPRHLYSNAVSLNSTFWEGASVGGPFVAGAIYGLLGISAAYVADLVLVCVALSFYLTIPNQPVPPVSEEQGIGEKIKAGLQFVFKNQIVLAAISLDLFAVLFGGAVALLPIFADTLITWDKEWKALGLGILRASTSVGAITTAVLITHYPIKKHMGRILLFCVGGFGLCMIAFGLSTYFWLSVFILMLSGAFDSVSVIIRGILIHTLTPENMKGRVSAVNSMFVGSSNEIGAFESGFTARFFNSAVRAVVFGGFMTLFVVGFTGWKAKKLRRLDTVS